MFFSWWYIFFRLLSLIYKSFFGNHKNYTLYEVDDEKKGKTLKRLGTILNENEIFIIYEPSMFRRFYIWKLWKFLKVIIAFLFLFKWKCCLGKASYVYFLLSSVFPFPLHFFVSYSVCIQVSIMSTANRSSNTQSYFSKYLRFTPEDSLFLT